MTVHLHDIHTRAELLEIVGPGDAFARLDPAERITGWTAAGAVGILRSSAAHDASLYLWGGDVAALLDRLAEEGPLHEHGLSWVSVPLTDLDRLEQRFGVTGGDIWDWMWTDRAPRPPTRRERGEAVELVELDDTRDAEEITALAEVENPLFEGFPGTGISRRWLGVRREGALVACGAVQSLPSGVAHLGGILVASRWRRHGLGSAISSALTADVVETEGVCTLGVYTDNAPARALYEGLGYVTDKRWATRRVAL